jgi:D-alanine transaminase
MPPDEAKVSIWDRGFVFGDAVYEVLRIYRGRCWLEDEHWSRLRRSLSEMRIVGVDLDRLKQTAERTIVASGVLEGTLYIQVTRGVAPRTHAFPNPVVPPTELISVRPYDDLPMVEARETGVEVISYPDLRWRRCDVKSTNLLGNVLANEAAHQAGAYEAVLISPEGLVTEATHSSLLWVRGGRIEGTPDGPGILPGTTRISITRLAEAERIPFAESTIDLAALQKADEVFLSGTTIEVLPIARIDGDRVSSGIPGPITRRLQTAFRRALDVWLTQITASGGRKPGA